MAAFFAARPSRRGFLHAGMLGTAGPGLATLLRLQHASAGGSPAVVPARQPSVIILWMRGGPSQHETWDPKPEAPVEYRGYFGSIPTSVPGIRICDMLPLSAKCMNKWSIVRSLHHNDAGHSSGDQLCFTGYPSQGAPDINARDTRLIGQRAQVVQGFVDGRGRVFVSGAEWVAEIEGAAPAAGESVIVEGMDGPKLKVRAA